MGDPVLLYISSFSIELDSEFIFFNWIDSSISPVLIFWFKINDSSVLIYELQDIFEPPRIPVNKNNISLSYSVFFWE